MRVAEVARILDGAPLAGDPEQMVCGVAYDSRKVEPGFAFVCVRGHQVDGHDFAHQAVENGAALLVCERPPAQTPEGVAVLQVSDSRRALAQLSAAFLGSPAERLLTVGITGTNGKTSTAYLCRSVLRQAGFDTGLIGTIQAHIGGQSRPLQNTTPESLDLQSLLREMVDAEQDSVVMEVSSHALALDRVYGLPFDVGVYTNLSQDHLDFHPTMEDYFQAKLKLFKGLGSCWSRQSPPFAVINLDDAYACRILEFVRVPFITYGFHPRAHVRAEDVETGPDGTSFRLVTPVGERRVDLQLSGMFNVSNSLAAISVGLAQRIDLDDAIRGVEEVPGIRGRFELVRQGQDFTVIVDYAHTPDGLCNLLESAREVTRGRLITVFGCGGDRDRGKRPQMGEIAGRLSDYVVLTSDNPRSEDPETILDQIEAGMTEARAEYEREVDRTSAIGRAIGLAEAGDTVVIAGKGHETYQIFADRTIAFDDVEVAGQAIRVRTGVGGRRGKSVDPQQWSGRRRAISAIDVAAKGE